MTTHDSQGAPPPDEDPARGPAGRLSERTSDPEAEVFGEGSPAFLRSVLDTVPGLVFVFDEGDGIVWGNRRLQEKTGYTPATLRGMEPAQLFGDADAKAVRHALQAVRRGSTPVTVRVTLLTNGGRTIPCEFTGRCLPEGAGQAGGVVGTGRELSVLEERERELRRERDRLSALYAGLPSPVVHYRVKNGAALVQGVNTAFEEVFGFSEADILGEDLDGFIAPEDQVRQAETLTREAVEEGIVQAEVVRETEGGRHYFRLDSVLFSGGDRPEGYAIYTDVTEQKEREQTLRDEQEDLRSMYRIMANQETPFEAKVKALIALGCDYLGLSYGFLSHISDDMQRIVEAAGDHPQLQSGETCPLAESYCRKTVQQENLMAVQDARAAGWEDDPAHEAFGLGAYIGTKILVDGELYGTFCFADAAVRDAPFTERERTFVELMTRWVSYELEQRRAQEHLERQNERLDSFASLVTHDLRNPLNVAQARLELAKSESPSEHLGSIERALTRMDEIIDDVLALTWGGQDLAPEDLEYCDLTRLARGCWEHVDMSEATLHTEDGPIVKANPGRLRRLLENLFRNAVEHGGDSVTIWVGGLDDGFYVEDDGSGIPEAQRGKVFESGYSSEHEGTGLGLNIVQTIAASHGWGLSLAEGREGGARFEVTDVEVGT